MIESDGKDHHMPDHDGIARRCFHNNRPFLYRSYSYNRCLGLVDDGRSSQGPERTEIGQEIVPPMISSGFSFGSTGSFCKIRSHHAENSEKVLLIGIFDYRNDKVEIGKRNSHSNIDIFMHEDFRVRQQKHSPGDNPSLLLLWLQ
jgi:hypothetical protein